MLSFYSGCSSTFPIKQKVAARDSNRISTSSVSYTHLPSPLAICAAFPEKCPSVHVLGQKGVVRTGIQKSEQFLIVMDRLRPAQELQAYPEEGDWDICHQDQLKGSQLSGIAHHQMINQRYSQQNRKSQRK